MDEKEKFETVLDEAIRLMEAGEERAAILARFPDFQKELSEAFRIADRISFFGKDIKPDKALLEKIVREVNTVTQVPEKRFSYISSDSKGRRLLVNPLIQIHSFMNMQMKYVLPIVAVFVVAGGVLYMNYGGVSPQVAQNTQVTSKSAGTESAAEAGDTAAMKAAAPASTGNPDEIVDDIIASLAEEETILNDANADADFVAYDSALVGEFGQFSYE